jgi:hypothetical protein
VLLNGFYYVGPIPSDTGVTTVNVIDASTPQKSIRATITCT